MNEFVKFITNEAIRAIDKRAQIKINLMFPNLSIYLNEFENCHTVLPQNWIKHAWIADKFRKQIQLWDNVWNSLNQVNWLKQFGMVFKQNIEIIICYLEDKKSKNYLPMLVYTIDNVIENSQIEYICPACAVAISAFHQVGAYLDK